MGLLGDEDGVGFEFLVGEEGLGCGLLDVKDFHVEVVVFGVFGEDF